MCRGKKRVFLGDTVAPVSTVNDVGLPSADPLTIKFPLYSNPLPSKAVFTSVFQHLLGLTLFLLFRGVHSLIRLVHRSSYILYIFLYHLNFLYSMVSSVSILIPMRLLISEFLIVSSRQLAVSTPAGHFHALFFRRIFDLITHNGATYTATICTTVL